MIKQKLTVTITKMISITRITLSTVYVSLLWLCYAGAGNCGIGPVGVWPVVVNSGTILVK